jgi:hypothetical protein
VLLDRGRIDPLRERIAAATRNYAIEQLGIAEEVAATPSSATATAGVAAVDNPAASATATSELRIFPPRDI